MSEQGNQNESDALLASVMRKTGTSRRPPVQETSDPTGRRPVAQWVISGSVARPAHEVLPDPSTSAGVPARFAGRPSWWLLGISAVAGFAIAIPVTWFLFSLLIR